MFDIRIYCRMSTTIKLINICITSVVTICVWGGLGVRLFQICPLNKFQVDGTVLLTVITMLDIRS